MKLRDLMNKLIAENARFDDEVTLWLEDDAGKEYELELLGVGQTTVSPFSDRGPKIFLNFGAKDNIKIEEIDDGKRCKASS